MMHVFDEVLECTNSEADLDLLLSNFYGGADTSGEICPQMKSEVKCFWMAVGVLCPERTRVELQQKRDAGELTDYQIADYLKVPEVYVPNFFNPRYKHLLASLTD
ncbi:hypothetical protein CSC71_12745 [Pseudoxanthomonas sangjuensis]|nr:hypothetical protein CSC71_12745 [Pseudoxanthomonas sangjuensis]